MAFSRLPYDKDITMLSEINAMKPGLYHLNPPPTNEKHYQSNPNIRLQKMGNSISNSSEWNFFAGPVDVESELFDITRKASKCPHNKYQPICNDCFCLNQGEVCGSGVVGGCNVENRPSGSRCQDTGQLDMPDVSFNVENTRLTNPACMFRGVSTNRFEYPIHDPQDRIMFPSMKNVNTRALIKDNYKRSGFCRKMRKW